MLDTKIPTLETKLKEPLERKFKQLLQRFLDVTNEIKVDKRLKEPDQEIEKRKSRFLAQEKFKEDLGILIVDVSTDLHLMKTQILGKMFPFQYSALTDKQMLGTQQRTEVNNFLSKPRTKEQILYYFDFYLTTQQYDAVFHFYELLRRTNHSATGKEREDTNLLSEIESKIKSLKEKLGIDKGQAEVDITEDYLNQVRQLYDYLNSQVDLILEGFQKVSSGTLQLIYETYPELYETIEKNSYTPGIRSFI